MRDFKLFNPLKKVKNPRLVAAKRNQEIFLDYFYRFEELATNMFLWKNLPDTIPPRFIEITIFEYGKALFFRDDVLNEYLVLPFNGIGHFNIYGEPMVREAYGMNGYHATLTDKDSVYIANNYLMSPTYPTVILYCERLMQIVRAIEVNVNSQKTPLAVLCSETERLSFQNIYSDYDGNVPVIFGSKELDLSSIQTINTQSPFVADKLQLLFRQTINECLSFIGVYNGASEKRERQVSTEAVASLGMVNAQRNVMLNSRRYAAKLINEKYGLNIEPVINEEFETIMNDADISSSLEEG